MAYTKEKLENILNRIALSLDIGDDLFDKADNEYKALGKWIGEKSSQYDVSIYPQGSFALGTVIKPITDNDDYDIDLVCELAEQYNLSARALKKDVVFPWLSQYRKTNYIEEKRKCWHVEYSEVLNFHMDIIPSYLSHEQYINITNHNEVTDEYKYEISNPKGYEAWFMSRCATSRRRLYENDCIKNEILFSEADIEKLSRNKYKTPLQRTVQLLKRHRDVMFEQNPDDKPISIIITTLCGYLYNDESSVVDALTNIVGGMRKFIIDNKKGDKYFIANPSCPTDNFADKWNLHPERARAFFKWLSEIEQFFNRMSLDGLDTISMGNMIKAKFGEKLGLRVLNEMSEETRKGMESRQLSVDGKTGSLTKEGTHQIRENHHYD